MVGFFDRRSAVIGSLPDPEDGVGNHWILLVCWLAILPDELLAL